MPSFFKVLAFSDWLITLLKEKKGWGNNYRKVFEVPVMLIFFLFQFQNDDLYNLNKSFF